MLQINTGKLFQRGIERTNLLRGVLYSNAWLMPCGDIATSAGTLRVAGGGPSDRTMVYELDERIEKVESGPSALISHTVTPYLSDFSVVASFGLNVLVSPNHDLVSRMIEGGPKFSARDAPNAFVRRFFDEKVILRAEDGKQLTEFIDELLGLERRHFLSAMRAMRTFIAAMHSIPSDLGLSYALLVSAAETFVQDFDDYQSDWNDIDPRKQKAINKALDGLPKDRIKSVRDAITKADHLALSRRYRKYIQSKIGPDYFRTGEALIGRSIARWELPEALKQAYGLRSRYIHSAKPLPDALTMPHKHWETTEFERRPALTFQGLTRLTRHVIRSFVHDGPKIERETYDYSLERAGIMRAELAPRYWVARPLVKPENARRRLEGLLSELTAVDLRSKGATLTDLRSMLKDVESLFPQAPDSNRPALYALHVLFNFAIMEVQRRPTWREFMERYAEVGYRPASEILIVRVYLENYNWDIEIHREAHNNYWKERIKPTGLHAPALLEAATALSLAERYRSLGDHDEVGRFINEAVECLPGNKALLQFEESVDFTQVISWRTILLPSTS